MTREQDILIGGPQCAPFAPEDMDRCRACGGVRDGRWRLFLRWLRGKGPKRTSVDITWCPGEQEPTKEIGRIFGHKVEVKNECVGLMFPHLHLRCKRCGAKRLMHTKERAG